MKRRIRTSGNEGSARITIPSFIVDTLKLLNGQEVDITMDGDKIIINTKIKE